MPRLAFSWTVTINAPVEQVFSYLRDPENTFRAEGGGDPHVEITDIKVTPEGVGTTGRNVISLPGLKRLGITGSVINEIIEVVPNRPIVVKPPRRPAWRGTPQLTRRSGGGPSATPTRR